VERAFGELKIVGREQCMVVSSIVQLECPFCHWIFKASATDSLHVSASTKEPRKNERIGEIVQEKQRCRNPKCQKPFTIYWNDSMYIDRV
jgi:hypothetical protein